MAARTPPSAPTDPPTPGGAAAHAEGCSRTQAAGDAGPNARGPFFRSCLVAKSLPGRGAARAPPRMCGAVRSQRWPGKRIPSSAWGARGACGCGCRAGCGHAVGRRMGYASCLAAIQVFFFFLFCTYVLLCGKSRHRVRHMCWRSVQGLPQGRGVDTLCGKGLSLGHWGGFGMCSEHKERVGAPRRGEPPLERGPGDG